MEIIIGNMAHLRELFIFDHYIDESERALLYFSHSLVNDNIAPVTTTISLIQRILSADSGMSRPLRITVRPRHPYGGIFLAVRIEKHDIHSEIDMLKSSSLSLFLGTRKRKY
jgi:hypothetical protein